MISLDQAHQKVNRLQPLSPVRVSLDKAFGLFCAEAVHAAANCPTVDASLKDGFAVRSGDIASASEENPVQLHCVGTVTAGDQKTGKVQPGQAIRIMTGAAIPTGADAVLSSEFSRQERAVVHAFRDAHAGRNILARGIDVQSGQLLLDKGTRLGPAHMGLLAAAGVAELSVHRLPRVLVVATGSELVAPGEAIAAGQVAASNLVTLVAELQSLGITADQLIVRDNLEQLQEKIRPLLGSYDVILTCGGVLDGDKDFTLQAMEQLEVTFVFQRVRVGPGKGVCFGRKKNTLIFNLPGGPPSNHIAYLLLAKPAILRLLGDADPLTTWLPARLSEAVYGQKEWVQIVYGCLSSDELGITVTPVTGTSRLLEMATADCLLEIPAHCSSLQENTIQKIWKIR